MKYPASLFCALLLVNTLPRLAGAVVVPAYYYTVTPAFQQAPGGSCRGVTDGTYVQGANPPVEGGLYPLGVSDSGLPAYYQNGVWTSLSVPANSTGELNAGSRDGTFFVGDTFDLGTGITHAAAWKLAGGVRYDRTPGPQCGGAVNTNCFEFDSHFVAISNANPSPWLVGWGGYRDAQGYSTHGAFFTRITNGYPGITPTDATIRIVAPHPPVRGALLTSVNDSGVAAGFFWDDAGGYAFTLDLTGNANAVVLAEPPGVANPSLVKITNTGILGGTDTGKSVLWSPVSLVLNTGGLNSNLLGMSLLDPGPGFMSPSIGETLDGNGNAVSPSMWNPFFEYVSNIAAGPYADFSGWPGNQQAGAFNVAGIRSDGVMVGNGALNRPGEAFGRGTCFIMTPTTVPYAIQGAAGQVLLPVLLSAAVPGTGSSLQIRVASSNPFFASVPQTVTVNSGQNTALIPVGWAPGVHGPTVTISAYMSGVMVSQTYTL